ncbi:uncharacterized protein LOC113360076 [Papaver somniferum]|uniref:uncharacterized protein LOC113360076 n=1 Tax=Papaver somniferum TaxID=3469 RepID=UPI000E701686|nr:uncharacterized protein LOC113360076 [Papaver somniferum]
MKFSDDVSNLKSQWKLVCQCKIIPLGEGFFTIKLDNERDQNYTKAGNWEVYNQTLWIRNWIPDFRPELHRTSSAMVWVHYLGLSLEYWDEQTLFAISKALGNPVKVYEATLNFENGLYARLPKFCHHCKIVGHLQAECRVEISAEVEASNNQENQRDATKNFKPISPEQTADKGKNTSSTLNVATTPLIAAQKEQVDFETLNIVIEEEIDIQMSEGNETLTPAKILQIAEDNAMEKSVINFINDKNGSVSEERVPTTLGLRDVEYGDS